MIYCNLKGGLGNMLFQIAAAKSIAIDTNNDCSFPNLVSHLQYLDSDGVYNPTLKHSSEYMQLLKNLKTVCLNCTIEIPKQDLPWRPGDLEPDR